MMFYNNFTLTAECILKYPLIQLFACNAVVLSALLYIYRIHRVFFSHKFPGYFQVKMTDLQVLVWTILVPKGRRPKHSKIAGAQTLETFVLIKY